MLASQKAREDACICMKVSGPILFLFLCRRIDEIRIGQGWHELLNVAAEEVNTTLCSTFPLIILSPSPFSSALSLAFFPPFYSLTMFTERLQSCMHLGSYFHRLRKKAR